MATRTRKQTPASGTPAKKAPAKTAAKRAVNTANSRKTTTSKAPAKQTAKKPLPAAAPVNDTATPAPPKLRARRKVFTGPMGATEQAAVRAALAAARAALPIPVRAWHGSQAQLADGTLLIHNPGPDRHFTAHIACPHGAIHGWPITTHHDLAEARAVTRICQTPHTEPDPTEDLDWDKAIRAGVTPLTQPTVKVSPLTEGLKRAKKAAADTQGLSRADIDTGLAARADHDQPKEHPQP
ncbi:hypothetical protein ACFVOR_37425 [Streptomyces sp. NPDC057837]|uniref:hypothetical protein n=1 Tax=Streptomyces sp. NPDC057837 TaxID=3346260 RepID=UPI00367626A6